MKNIFTVVFEQLIKKHIDEWIADKVHGKVEFC